MDCTSRCRLSRPLLGYGETNEEESDLAQLRVCSSGSQLLWLDNAFIYHLEMLTYTKSESEATQFIVSKASSLRTTSEAIHKACSRMGAGHRPFGRIQADSYRTIIARHGGLNAMNAMSQSKGLNG